MSRKHGPIVGYSINGLVHAPADVTIIYGPRPHGLIRRIWWWLKDWIWIHRKGLWIALAFVVACILSAVITAHHPT